MSVTFSPLEDGRILCEIEASDGKPIWGEGDDRLCAFEDAKEHRQHYEWCLRLADREMPF